MHIEKYIILVFKDKHGKIHVHLFTRHTVKVTMIQDHLNVPVQWNYKKSTFLRFTMTKQNLCTGYTYVVSV